MYSTINFQCFSKFDLYETVPEVRERMAELATKRLCKDVKAIYFFDMLGKKSFSNIQIQTILHLIHAVL